MKVSIVTVCRNAAATIGNCLSSVGSQEEVEIEHIVIDGASTDGTMDILRRHADQIAELVSEPDRGIYDAMNKGLHLATGDVVGFLNSDDVLASNDAIFQIVRTFGTRGIDAVFGDVEIYNSSGKLVRIYRGSTFRLNKMGSGLLPPHPSFYARTALLREVGGFRTSFKIAADFDLMMRIFASCAPTWAYLPTTVVQMRSGGASNMGLSSYATISRELVTACRNNNIRPNELAIHGRVLRKGWESAEALGLRIIGKAPRMNTYQKP